MDKSRYSFDKYKEDKIRAIDARFEAQKIAFSPLTFQAIRALIELGILNLIEDAGDAGISIGELSKKNQYFGIRRWRSLRNGTWNERSQNNKGFNVPER